MMQFKSKILSQAFLILVLVGLNGCGETNNAGVVMYRGTVEHTGYFPGESLATSPKVVDKYGLINYGIHTASKSSPILDGQNVYVGSDAGFVYAFDKNSLKLKWKFKVRSTAIYGTHSTPACDDKKVYISAYDGWLYALDKGTGKLLWQSQVGNYVGSSPIIEGDYIYLGVETPGPDGYVVAINKNDGSRHLTSFLMKNNVHATPTIDKGNNLLYIGTNAGKFYALDLSTLKMKWEFKTGGPVKSTAALANGKLVLTSWDHCVYCLDPLSGKVLWKFKTNGKNMSSPTIDTDEAKVYFGSHDAKFYCLDLNNGKKIWEFQAQNVITSSGTLINSDQGKMIVFGSHDFNIYGLNASTGSQIFNFKTQGKVTSVPAVYDHKLYVSGDDGFLYVFK